MLTSHGQVISTQLSPTPLPPAQRSPPPPLDHIPSSPTWLPTYQGAYPVSHEVGPHTDLPETKESSTHQ